MTLRKVVLKRHQLWSAPLSLGTATQEILFTYPLNSCKLTLSVFRILTLLLEITNSVRARLLQPSLPAISTPLMTSSPLVSTRSSNYSFLVVLPNTWTKKLSSAHCRSPMDCLQLAVLLSQEKSGWFSWLSQPSGGLFWSRHLPREAVSFLAGFQPQLGSYDG